MRTLLAAAAVSAIGVLLATGPAGAEPAAGTSAATFGEEARIPFADSVGIRNFRAESDRALYIEGPGGRWYYAETLGPCSGLNFANAIGIVTKGTNTLDKFGQIVVDGRTCQLSSLVTAEEPARGGKPDASGPADDPQD